MEKNKLPQRKHPRLKDYDYSSFGTFFVTICVANPNVVLSTIKTTETNTEHKLTKYGLIVEDCILKIAIHHPEITIDNYCIMPDHVHILLSRIDNDDKIKHFSSLMQIVGQMKRAVSKTIGYSIWQTSFYEEIIEKKEIYDVVYDYITNNPYVYNNTDDKDCYFTHNIYRK